MTCNKVYCEECGELVTPTHHLRPYTCPECAKAALYDAKAEMGLDEFDDDDIGCK